jgi:hypothetical protein
MLWRDKLLHPKVARLFCPAQNLGVPKVQNYGLHIFCRIQGKATLPYLTFFEKAKSTVFKKI